MLSKFSHKTYTYNNSWFYFCVLKHMWRAHMHTEIEICRKGTLDPIHKGYTLQAISQNIAFSELIETP